MAPTIPPRPATTGRTTRGRSRNSPTSNSRRASRPTTKKKKAIRPLLIHSAAAGTGPTDRPAPTPPCSTPAGRTRSRRSPTPARPPPRPPDPPAAGLGAQKTTQRGVPATPRRTPTAGGCDRGSGGPPDHAPPGGRFGPGTVCHGLAALPSVDELSPTRLPGTPPATLSRHQAEPSPGGGGRGGAWGSCCAQCAHLSGVDQPRRPPD